MTQGYELLEEIGRGAMGSVHLARARGQRLVALKVLHAHLAVHAHLRQRFRREIDLCIKLSHPAVIKVLDVGELDDRPFYTMEYLEDAAPLSALISSEGSLDVEIALDVMRALLDALAYCHSRNCLHRDLKPSNLMIGPADRVTVMDFGLAREVESTMLTTPGTVLGTPRYLSPEMVRGGNAAASSDIWSAGAVFFEMLTGRPPFTGSSLPDVIREILDVDPPPVSRVRSNLPATLDPLVARFLEKDAQKRYLTAEEAMAALDSWTLRHGMAPPEATASVARLRRPVDLSSGGLALRRTTRSMRALHPESFVTQSRGPRRAWLAVGAVLLVALIALVTKAAKATHDARASWAAMATEVEVPVADRGARLRVRLAKLDPLGLERALRKDLTRGHLDRRSWLTRMETAVHATALRDAIGQFRPVRDAYYAAPDVPAGDKVQLYELVQDLIDLEDGLQRLDIKLPLGARFLESAEYGPLTGAAPLLTARLLELDPTTHARDALRLAPDSTDEPPGVGGGRLKSVVDRRLANADELSFASLTDSWYQHPRPFEPPPGRGPIELRALVERFAPPIGITMRVDRRAVLRLRAPTIARQMLRYRLPAGVLPDRPFLLTLEVAYADVFAALTRNPEENAGIPAVALGRGQ